MSFPIIHPIGAKVRLSDRRFEKNQPAIVLDNSAYPLYSVRLGTNQYDTKAVAVVVAASKIDLA